jgi:hypothetical protein
MDDFIREGDRLRRTERKPTYDVVWNFVWSPVALGVGIWLVTRVADAFDPRNAGSWIMAAFCIAWFHELVQFVRRDLNVTEHSIFFDLREGRFGEVFERRVGPPIERTWPLDAIEAIEIVKMRGILDRVFTRGVVAQIRVAGERRPFVVCAAMDPLKAKAVVERVKTHLGRF